MNNDVFKQKFNEQSNLLITAFLNYAIVDYCHWSGKIIGLAYNTCNLQAVLAYPKINVYANNSSFENQVMDLSACFGKCFNFWILEEREEVVEEEEKEKMNRLMKQYKDTIMYFSLEKKLFCIPKTVSKEFDL